MFVWGFDKTSTSLDDLIEYFENNFRNVVNIRQRTAPVKEEEEEQEGPEKAREQSLSQLSFDQLLFSLL